MKKIFDKIYYESKIGFALLNPIVKIIEFFRYGLISDVSKVRKEFIINLGYNPNLKDPKTFNEKCQWFKLNDRTPLHTLCADKFKVREYIKDLIGEQYLVPLLFQTKNIREINEKTIPDFPVIVKTNHASSGGIIIKTKKDVNWVRVQNTLGHQLSINYYYRFKEWQYKNIERRIIVEKLLLDDQGNIPNDYKLYFFNGEFEFIQVDMGKLENKWRRNIYDKDWNLMDFIIKRENGDAVPKPEILDKMIELGKKLAKPFSFVRVDFYYINNILYFGELTFHPNSGHSMFEPKSYDLFYGEKLKLLETTY